MCKGGEADGGNGGEADGEGHGVKGGEAGGEETLAQRTYRRRQTVSAASIP